MPVHDPDGAMVELVDRTAKMSDVNAGLVNIPSWMNDRPPIKLPGLAPTHNRATVFIDTEFSGFPVRSEKWGNAQPVDVCAIKVRSNGMQEEYEAMIRISDDHQRSRERLGWERVVGYDHKRWSKEGRRSDDVARELLEFVSGCAWVSHGPADVQLWTQVWAGEQLPWVPGQVFPVMCTEMLARRMLPGLKKYTIDALCEHFGLPGEKEHRARGGAERCMKIYQKLCGLKNTTD